MPGRQAWGDDDDDDYLPPRQESAVDAKGVKSIVEYFFNENEAKVKQKTKKQKRNTTIGTTEENIVPSMLSTTKKNKSISWDF